MPAEFSEQVAAALARVADGVTIADVEEAVHLALLPGTPPQEIWALVAFIRHERRQVWLGGIVESRLRGSGIDLARRGAFGHPEDIPQKGEVPGEVGWRYFFHGRGCEFTGPDGTSIDVDFADDGSALEIDPYFVDHFLKTCGNPGWCERQLRYPAKLESAWHFELSSLDQAGLIQGKHRFRLTDEGRNRARAIEPLVEVLDDGHGLARAYLLARLGDYVSALEILRQMEAPTNFLKSCVDQQRRQRFQALVSVVHGSDKWKAMDALAALSVFEKDVAFPEVQRAFAQRPVTGLNHKALAVLSRWDGKDVDECLFQNLGELTYTSLGTRIKQWLRPVASPAPAEDQPRLGLIVGIVRRLLEVLKPREVSVQRRMRLVQALATNCRAVDDTAGFLLFLLDPKAGRQRLVFNLTNPIPSPRSGAACFLAIIGDDWCLAALVRAAEGDPERGGHEAACALSLLGTEKARAEVERWNRRHDGYEEAEGSEMELDGRKFRTWSMEEIMRSDLRQHLSYNYQQAKEEYGPLIDRWMRS